MTVPGSKSGMGALKWVNWQIRGAMLGFVSKSGESAIKLKSSPRSPSTNLVDISNSLVIRSPIGGIV